MKCTHKIPYQATISAEKNDFSYYLFDVDVYNINHKIDLYNMLISYII